MTDSSIGIQAVSPFAGTSQGRNEAFRDQSAQRAAAKFAEQQVEAQSEEAAQTSDTTRTLDVTV
jgi:hypothetical protein